MTTTWDAEQLAIAQATVQEVKREGLPLQAAEIAIAAEITESGLHNLPAGDRDSAGVLQQRPSQGWGTWTQVTNVPHAVGAFLAHLVAVPGWASKAPWIAAQDVQRSAFADGSNYAAHYAEGRQLADALWSGQVPGGATATPISFPGVGGVAGAAGGVAGAIGGAVGGAAGDVGGAVVKATLPFLLKLTFVAGGIALGVAGLWQAAEPARRAAAPYVVDKAAGAAELVALA